MINEFLYFFEKLLLKIYSKTLGDLFKLWSFEQIENNYSSEQFCEKFFNDSVNLLPSKIPRDYFTV